MANMHSLSLKIAVFAALAGVFVATSVQADQNCPTQFWYCRMMQKLKHDKAHKAHKNDGSAQGTPADADNATPPPAAAPLPPAAPVRRTRQGSVIVYGAATDDASWNKALDVSGTHYGCSSPPPQCVTGAVKSIKGTSVQDIYLYFLLNRDTAIQYAEQYSQLSLANPSIVEIGNDDFISLYGKLGGSDSDKVDFVRKLISAVKSHNPKLAYGIVLYTDELDSRYVQSLPMDIRAGIDSVHLYIHSRAQGATYAADVRRAKSVFPNATIIAGVYAMDRIDYMPCRKGTHANCSRDEELNLFRQTFQTQMNLWKSGQVAALEFYTGYFGHENDITNFAHADQCQPSRRGECVSNTQQMREMARSMLAGGR